MAPAVVPVHGAELAADIVPQAVVEPRHVLVRVVQEGGQHQVGREDELGHTVVHHQLDGAGCDGVLPKTRGPHRHQNHGHRAGRHVARQEGVGGVEVVDAAGVVAHEEVSEPGDAEAEGRGEVGVLVVPLADGIEDLVLVHVAREGVVLAVRQLPAVVGAEQEAVQHVAHRVVEQSVAGEGSVAGVVAQHEQGPEEGALKQPVDRQHQAQQPARQPAARPQPLRQQVQPHRQDHVLGHVVKRGAEAGLEHVAGQRALDLAQSGQSVRQVVFAQRLLPLLLRGCVLARLFRARGGRGSVCFLRRGVGLVGVPVGGEHAGGAVVASLSRHRLQAGRGSGTDPTPSVRLPWVG